jgi:acetolactate synthase I/II/III large subunit
VAFGLMGEDLAKLVEHLSVERGDVTYYAMRHESGAVAAADGFARTSDELGVAIVSRGPGLTNALTAIGAASLGRSRTLVLVGSVSTAVMVSYAKDINQEGILSSLGVAWVKLRSEASVAEDLTRALDLARSGRTTVLLLPVDILEREADSGCTSAARSSVPRQESASPADIARVADLCEESTSPLILVGRGLTPNARGIVEDLAARLGALVGTTLPAKGWFAGHPADIGLVGGFATPGNVELAGKADLVLAFGASLKPTMTRGLELFADKPIVVFDLADRSAESVVSAQLVRGDAASGAEALLDELVRRRVDRGLIGAPTPSGLAWPKVNHRPAGGRLDPRALVQQLDRVLPQPRTTIADGGHCGGFACMYLSSTAARSFISTTDFSAIGLSLGTAIGAAVAVPDRLTVVVVGDGSFWMTIGELETAVRYGLRILVLVLDDSAYGAELHYLRGAGMAGRSTLFPESNISAASIGIGADATIVATPAQIVGLSSLLATVSGPVVADCLVDPDVRADWLQSLPGYYRRKDRMS